MQGPAAAACCGVEEATSQNHPGSHSQHPHPLCQGVHNQPHDALWLSKRIRLGPCWPRATPALVSTQQSRVASLKGVTLILITPSVLWVSPDRLWVAPLGFTSGSSLKIQVHRNSLSNVRGRTVVATSWSLPETLLPYLPHAPSGQQQASTCQHRMVTSLLLTNIAIPHEVCTFT